MKKKNFKILCTVCAIAFAAICYGGYCLYNIYYGESDRWKLQNNLTAVKYNNGDYVIVDSKGKTIGKRMDDLDFNNSCFAYVFKIGEKYGFVSAATGCPIFPAQFDYAQLDDGKFGLAAIVKDGLLGYANVRTGAIAIPPQFPTYPDADGWWNISSFDYDGYCVIRSETGKGVIDTVGNIICPLIYDYIDYLAGVPYRVICFGEYYALYDSAFNQLLPFEYKEITYTEFGFNVETENSSQLLSFSCKEILNYCVLDNQNSYYEDTQSFIEHLYEPAENENGAGKLSPYKKLRSAGKYGIFNNNYQNVIVQAKYKEIQYLGNGYFACVIDDEKAIILDKYGKEVHGNRK